MSSRYTYSHGALIHFNVVQSLVSLILVISPLYAFSQTIEQKMLDIGLVRVRDYAPKVMVDLKYNSTDNFVGVDMYGGLNDAYLRPHMAERLRKAQVILEREYSPDYRIIIYDAARPLSAQRRMYDLVKGTPLKVYVASPHRGGRHNYGVAVDLSIWDLSQGEPLDMGGDFDQFDAVSHVGQEDRLVRTGKISAAAQKNRQMLYSVMRRVGLVPYRREWWHYEQPESMSEVRRQYPLLDF